MHRFLKHHKTVSFALRLIAALVMVWFLCALLFSFSINLFPKSSTQRLEEARATWETNGTDSYRMSVQMFIPLAVMGWFTVTVDNGDVSVSGPSPLETSPLTRDSDHLTFPKESTQYTVDGLFDFAASVISQFPDETPIFTTCDTGAYEITFNAEFGYIELLTIGDCGGGGLLCTRLSDCPSGFRITDFELLSDS